MIRSFADKRTAALYAGFQVKGLGAQIQRRAKAKLQMLDAAQTLADLRVPPCNRLQALKGDRAGNTVFGPMISGACVSSGETAAHRMSRSSTTIRNEDMTIDREDIDMDRVDWRSVATGDRLPSIPPGEILRGEFLEPFGLSVYALAKAIKVTRSRLNDIVHGRRAITADTALRLARYFGTTPEFWLRLQSAHDLEVARAMLAQRVAAEVTPRAA